MAWRPVAPDLKMVEIEYRNIDGGMGRVNDLEAMAAPERIGC